MRLLFDSTERLRRQWDGITQTERASVGKRMNQVMKTVTILTSICGMNSDTMPELRWHYGFAMVLAAMLLLDAVPWVDAPSQWCSARPTTEWTGLVCAS